MSTSFLDRLESSWKVLRAPEVGSIATTSASMMKDEMSFSSIIVFINKMTSGYYEQLDKEKTDS